jgi:diguanylate cyclase (GGDEF)-like protein
MPGQFSGSDLLALIGPAILCVFSLAFLGTWFVERGRTYLLLFSASGFAFCVATLSQIISWPENIYYDSMFSVVLYTLSTLTLIEGVLWRSQKNFGWHLHLSGFVAIVLPSYYFCYLSPSLIARIYILNFGLGFLLLLAVFRLIHLKNGRVLDRLLFWVFLVVALHFFPRTTLSLGLASPATADAFGKSSFWLVLQLSLAVLGVVLALTLLAATVGDLLDDLREDRDTDPLTGILNRRGFAERAAASLAKQDGLPLSVILCDLDHFKAVNDTHGHAAGDLILNQFGQILRQMTRGSDVVGRIGGEEFVILLTNSSAEAAHDVAERLRTTLEQTRFEGLPPSVAVTASFGIAGHRTDDPIWTLVARADKMLYAAKRAGRNRTLVESRHRSGDIAPFAPEPSGG